MAGPGGVSVGKASVRVLPDTSKFREELTKYLNRTEKTLRVQVPVEADVDERSAAAAGKRIASIAQGAAGDIQVGMDANDTELVRDARRAVAAAQAAAGDIDVRMNVKGGAAVLAGLMVGAGAGMASMLGSMAQLTAMAGAATVAVAGLAAPLAAVASAAASALAPVAALTGALAVPAIAGAGVAFGTLKLSLSGMGDAINAADPQALADALAELPASAQSAALAMRDLKAQFTGLADEVKGNFWSAFSNIGDLSSVIEPLGAAMSTLATHFGSAASNLVTFVSAGTGLDMVTTLLNSGASSMANLGYALTNAVPGFLAVGAAASPVLEDITNQINIAADTWANRMVAGFQDGSLQAYFQDAVVKAQALWDVLSNLGGIVSGVFSAMAAGAGGVAGALAEGISSLNQWVNSGPGMATLTGFFQSMYGAVQAILPVLAQVGGIILGTVAPAIAEFIQAIGPGLSAVVGSLGDALASIAPAMGPVGAVLGQVLSALAPMAPAIAGVVAGFAVFSRVAGILAPVVTAVARLATLFSGLSAPVLAVVGVVGLLIAAFTQVPGAGAAIGGAFSTLMAAVQPLVGVIMQFVGTLVDMLVPVAAALVPVITQVVTVIAQIFTALTPVIAAILQVVATIVGALIPVIISLLPVVSMLVSAVGTIVTAMAPVITVVIQVIGVFVQLLAAIVGFVASALGMIVSFVAGVVSGFTSMVSTVVGAVSGFVSSIIGFFANMASQAIAKATSLWSSVVSTFSSGVSSAISFVAELPGRAVSALGNVGSLLVDSGKALIQGFINGIKSMFGAVGDAVGSIVSKARSFFPFSPAKEGPFSGHGWVLYSGRSVGEAFSQGLEDRRKMVGKSAQSLMATATGNLDSYKADVRMATGGSAGGARGTLGGVDTSVTIGTLIAADPAAPMREIATRQRMAEIKAGLG